MNRANESPEQRRQRHEDRNQRGRDQRENETPDQQLARQHHRNESDNARRENETSEEKQQLRHDRNEFDQAHHAAAVASGEASGDGRYDRHRQLDLHVLVVLPSSFLHIHHHDYMEKKTSKSRSNN
jgi:hypothetical protein